MSFVWYNGEVTKTTEAKIGLFNHSLHYGCSVFEGIRNYDLQQGSGIFRLQEHMERFCQSASLIGMPLGLTQEELVQAVHQTVLESKIRSGYIRPIAFFGDGLSGLKTSDVTTSVAILIWEWSNGTELPVEKKAIKLAISKYCRPDGRFTAPQAKVSGNYLNSRLAYLDAKSRGFQDAMLFDSNGFVSECTAQNIFFVQGGRIITPTTATCLSGITRASVIELARLNGYDVEERNIQAGDLESIDEAFTTSTAGEITPVVKLGDNIVGTGGVGEITKFLADLYRDTVKGLNQYSENWVYKV